MLSSSMPRHRPNRAPVNSQRRTTTGRTRLVCHKRIPAATPEMLRGCPNFTGRWQTGSEPTGHVAGNPDESRLRGIQRRRNIRSSLPRKLIHFPPPSPSFASSPDSAVPLVRDRPAPSLPGRARRRGPRRLGRPDGRRLVRREHRVPLAGTDQRGRARVGARRFSRSPSVSHRCRAEAPAIRYDA